MLEKYSREAHSSALNRSIEIFYDTSKSFEQWSTCAIWWLILVFPPTILYYSNFCFTLIVHGLFQSEWSLAKASCVFASGKLAYFFCNHRLQKKLNQAGQYTKCLKLGYDDDSTQLLARDGKQITWYLKFAMSWNALRGLISGPKN